MRADKRKNLGARGWKVGDAVGVRVEADRLMAAIGDPAT